MRLARFGFLADENIHPAVVTSLRDDGIDVLTVQDLDLEGAIDTAVLRRAVALGRFVLTHDSDFGRLAIAAGEPICGILYLRPGHIKPELTFAAIKALLSEEVDVTPPCIIVATRRGDSLWIRVRRHRMP